MVHRVADGSDRLMTWTAEELLAARPRPTGVWVFPSWLASRVGLWSAWDQRRCPHPPHRARPIHGDERLYGYRAQCLECGVYAR